MFDAFSAGVLKILVDGIELLPTWRLSWLREVEGCMFYSAENGGYCGLKLKLISD